MEEFSPTNIEPLRGSELAWNPFFYKYGTAIAVRKLKNRHIFYPR
jgi:hypothetical protein